MLIFNVNAVDLFAVGGDSLHGEQRVLQVPRRPPLHEQIRRAHDLSSSLGSAAAVLGPQVRPFHQLLQDINKVSALSQPLQLPTIQMTSILIGRVADSQAHHLMKGWMFNIQNGVHDTSPAVKHPRRQ